MFIDAIGTRHAIAPPNARIISLVPSLTELLFDLSLGPQIVGRTSFCIHPQPDVKMIKSVGGTKRINYNKLQESAPDYVLLNIDENPKELAAEITNMGINVIVTHPVKVSDNRSLYRLIGGIFNRIEEAEGLVQRFNMALSSLQQTARSIRPSQVLYIIWRDPWMTITNTTYIADFLTQVNWQVTPQTDDSRYPTFTLSETELDQYDLVLFSSEPYAFDQTHIDAFRKQHPRHASKAYLIDGEMTSWYGSRAIKGLAYLASFSKATI